MGGALSATSDSKRCHRDVERLFLSSQFTWIVFLGIVKSTSVACSCFSGGSTDEGSPSRHTDEETEML